MPVYDKSMFTWGSEIEIGDVPKSFYIPKGMGSWEYSETDILNLLPPFAGVAADPKGIDPPMGGEVNLRPSKSWEDHVGKIGELLDLFREAGHTPTTSFVSHTHVHVHIPGLRDDMEGLRKVVGYVQRNQEDIVRYVHAYQDLPEIKEGKKAKTYLKLDGGRLIPDWLCENLKQATSFTDFIRLYCCGKDGKTRGRPIRYAINLYCLKHTQTIEMRLFRASLDPQMLSDCFRFTEAIFDAALNDGPSAKEIIEGGEWKFPPFEFDLGLWNSFQATKKEPGGPKGKNRAYWIAQ